MSTPPPSKPEDQKAETSVPTPKSVKLEEITLAIPESQNVATAATTATQPEPPRTPVSTLAIPESQNVATVATTPAQPKPPPRTPVLKHRDPSLPQTIAPTANQEVDKEHNEDKKPPMIQRFKKFCYDRDEGSYCGRTCASWIGITIYSIMYLIFLCTFTFICLFIVLAILKQNTKSEEPQTDDMISSLLKYTLTHDVGLTANPIMEHKYPLIWYRTERAEDNDKYIRSLDRLLETTHKQTNMVSNLGPCGKRPYGYGDKPCIVVKINKQFGWIGIPLTPGSAKTKLAPVEVQKWAQKDDLKYWLHCQGVNSYDVEHIGKIQYFPDPPGFDSALFPLDKESPSPLVAFQISNFTKGISLAVECNLWFENGASSFAFLLYVPKTRNKV